MKKLGHFKYLLMFITTLFIVGCVGTMDTVASTAKIKLADELVDAGLAADTVVINAMSEQEANFVYDNVVAYKRFKSYYKDNPEQAALNIVQFETDYSKLKQKYKLTKLLVHKYWDQYSVNKQLELQFYDEQAKALDLAIDVALQKGERLRSINYAVNLGMLILKSNSI